MKLKKENVGRREILGEKERERRERQDKKRYKKGKYMGKRREEEGEKGRGGR